jgi:hypothetical protein
MPPHGVRGAPQRRGLAMMKKLSRHARVARLRDLMESATDLTEPVNYFLDHLAEDRKFMRRSQPAPLEPGGLLEIALQNASPSVSSAPRHRSASR